MTTYTNINKPSQNSYTPFNAVGKEQYDQNSIQYDDVSVFYDSSNDSQYTNVGKPTEGTYLLKQDTFALLLENGAFILLNQGDFYTKVAKPI